MKHSYQTYDSREIDVVNRESRKLNQPASQILSSTANTTTAAQSIMVWSYMLVLGVTALYTIMR